MAQPMRVLQHQELSAEAMQLAGMHQLGALQAEYKIALRKQQIILIVLALLLGIGLWALMFADLSDPNAGRLILGVGLLSLFFVGIAVYYLLYPVIYRSVRVYVCAGGFIFKKGNAVDIFRWEQIEAMWRAVTKHYTNGIYTGTTHKYTVRRKDGKQVIFNDRFVNVEALGDTISRAITNYLWPQVIEAYNAGKAITFGPLSISLQGVSNGRELLPWNQIKEMGVNRGVVTVRREGKWLNWSSVMAAKVPNIFVFMALVDYVLKGRR